MLGGVVVDGEARRREPRPGTRRLRDISHLYISKRPAAQTDPAWQPAPRRSLRLGLAGPRGRGAKVEVCANLAVQLSKLGRRTIILDLDPALPNVGFHLGLSPAAYLAHLAPEPLCRLERGAHGIRLIEGWGSARVAGLADELQTEVRDSDCVLVNLPESAAAAGWLCDLVPLLEIASGDTTVARAAARSPMFGAWMATSQRPPAARRAPHSVAVDATLWVFEASRDAADANPPSDLDALSRFPVRPVSWGDPASGPTATVAWARVPWHPVGARLPVSSLQPEHAAARLYESLAQSLLAGLGGTGGRHA